MSTNLFDLDAELDVRNYVKVRRKAVLNDTITFTIYVYNDNQPVDLTKFNVEFRAILPISGLVYSEVDNITKNNNVLTITCDSFMCSEVGEVVGSLRIWNTELKQKSSYQIVLKVLSNTGSATNTNSESVLSALSSLDLAINKYLELKVDIDSSIIEGRNLIQELNTSITNANDCDSKLKATISDSLIKTDILKQTIDDSVAKNTQLNTAIDNSVQAKTSLENTTTIGRDVLNQITTKNNEAIKTKSELDGSIAEADSKLQEFKNFDTDQIVEKSNRIYDEMFAEYELCTVEHRLNCIPNVQLLLNSGAFGKGGFGLVPFGGSSDCSYGTYKIRYISKGKFIIIVSKNYYYENAVVTRDTDYEYTINFNGNDNISMKVQLYSLPNDTATYLGDENENYLIDEQGRYILG